MLVTADPFGDFTRLSRDLKLLAKEGVIEVPEVKLLAMPGTYVRVKITAQLASYEKPGEFRAVERSLILTLSGCKDGYLLTK